MYDCNCETAYYINEITELLPKFKHILDYGGKEADVMRRNELVFRFHNPNSDKDTYNALAKIFTEIGCKKLEKAVAESGKERAENCVTEVNVQ